MNGDTLFGQWLKHRRKDLDLTQDGLAERAGCSPETIRKIEAGERRPSRQVAELLAEALEITPEQTPEFVRFARSESHAGGVGEQVVFTPAATGSTSTGGSAEERSPTTQATPRATPTNLTVPLTPLIGRERELAVIHDLMLVEGARLLTLTGPPGIGKTRLALDVAAGMLDRFPDGVFFVPLAPVSEPDLVIPAILETLGKPVTGAQPLLAELAEHLRNKSMLLLLDNFEQVVGAASPVVNLTAQHPHLKIMVTSREALNVRGEYQFDVTTLALPADGPSSEFEVLGRYPAVTLFLERARAVKADFMLTEENAPAVVEICRRLDGLPLAIELVAARSKLLPPQELLQRLVGSNGRGQLSLRLLAAGAQDLPARHQTLQAAIDWSYDLLDRGEQTLFARMGVFVGGCTLAGAEAVCAADGELPMDLLDGVSSLVDKSLLTRRDEAENEARFGMLETVREYALEQLAEQKEAGSLRRWHAAYFTRLAEEAEPHLTEADQKVWLARLEKEHDNIRAALRYCLYSEDFQTAARLGGALFRFWWMRGHWSEGRRWMGEVLARGEENGSLQGSLLAIVLLRAGSLALAQADYTPALELLERCLQLSRQIGDKVNVSRALGSLSSIMTDRGDYTRAREYIEEGLVVDTELGNKNNIAISLGSLGTIAYSTGEYREAEEYLHRSLALHRETGDEFSIALTLLNLGVVADAQGNKQEMKAFFKEGLELSQKLDARRTISVLLNNLGTAASDEGDYAEAERYYRESLAESRELGDKRMVAMNLANIGEVAFYTGSHEQANALYEEGLALSREMGSKDITAICLAGLGMVAVRRGQSAKAAPLFNESLLLVQELGTEENATLSVIGTANVALMEGQPEQAARLLGAVEASFKSNPTSTKAAELSWCKQLHAQVRQALDEETFAECLAEGRAITLEKAVAFAIETLIGA